MNFCLSWVEMWFLFTCFLACGDSFAPVGTVCLSSSLSVCLECFSRDSCLSAGVPLCLFVWCLRCLFVGNTAWINFILNPSVRSKMLLWWRKLWFDVCERERERLMVRPSHISQQGGETLYQFPFHRSAGLRPARAGITLNTLQDRITFIQSVPWFPWCWTCYTNDHRLDASMTRLFSSGIKVRFHTHTEANSKHLLDCRLLTHSRRAGGICFVFYQRLFLRERSLWAQTALVSFSVFSHNQALISLEASNGYSHFLLRRLD